MTTNKQWKLTARPAGRLTKDDFTWVEETLPAVAEGQMRLRNVYISMDPANRAWTNSADTYLPAIQLGDVMRGTTISIVEESNVGRFDVGSVVMGMGGWQAYVTTDGQGWNQLPPLPGLPLTAHFGLLSHIGMTAYFGLLDIGEPQEGETLVVSAAAGAVGSIVGQIGKIKGCRVVGIAGTDEKCAWLTDDLGFDAAINYKTENVYRALKQHCPDGIDIYFENVGGAILDMVLAQVNNFARIPVCGMISQYNATQPYGVKALPNLISKRVKMQGFIVLDYFDRLQEAYAALIEWTLSEQLQYRVHVEEGIERAPDVLNMLFDGQNRGKLILKVGSE